jgi:GT2 family glycosyltransferase
LQRVSPERDVVVKLDADVSVDPDYFERQLDAFDADPRLGIAGGACLELRRGMWRPVDVTEGHVRGAARAYRRQCLDDVSPLEEGVGWDGIDALKASLHGWRTYTVEGLAFYHHRPLGDRDGSRAARWKAQGRACWFMGYRPSYLLLRTLHRARRNPAALAMIWSYLGAAVRREPRYGDAEVRGHLRERQSVAAALRRARSSRGRAASLRP